MLDAHQLKAEDLQGLDAEAATKIAALMLQRIEAMSAEHAKQLAERDQTIKFKDVKLQKVTFELARLKAWKFGAKTETMTAEQRRLLEETVAEDEAALQAQLDALQGKTTPAGADTERRKPRRKPWPRADVFGPRTCAELVRPAPIDRSTRRCGADSSPTVFYD